MARKNGAVTVARMDCMSPDCGERVAVFQNALGYLYTRCPECACDQRKGAGHQAYIWRHMEPVAGVEIVRPPNLPDGYGEPGQPPQSAPPVPAEPIGTVPTVQSEKRGGGLVWLALGLLGVGVATVASAAGAGSQV
ncbi:hypothetical protein S7S_09290 [Isoalcanivorax pacificus W11-5]|uniref:Uncharacterized protein n=1 Tax=Isoalcanivorax pacificus W11-5 TaxID=391936 RepID=A0A0B4XND1_9GAMM|nr:hypothetical protein [Isoalcanivorax pacificus]AJD48270.1 hypothetical protein S7S_09290 [Isoalcanivorax pacificus W11-5]